MCPPRHFASRCVVMRTLLVVLLLVGVVPASAHALPGHCPVPAERDLAVTKAVYRVGLSLGADDKVMLAAFEAGWVESHMNNLPCGDRDSLGVFQQRPSMGWGTPEQISTVDYAAEQFFLAAFEVDDPELTPGQLADEVQRSCCPHRYDLAAEEALAMLVEVATGG
jgi:hypothetical protein